MRFKQIIIFTTLLLLLISVNSFAAKKKQTFDKLCVEILESIQSFYPVKSTEMGIHAYDHRLTDYSSSSVKTMNKALKNYTQKLYKYKNTKLTPHQRINYKLVKADLETTLLNLKNIAWHKRSPQLYIDEAVNGLYFLMLSPHAPLNEKIVPIMSRIKAVPQLFATARKNIKKPPKVYIDGALEALESGSDFYKVVSAELMKFSPERADRISKIATQAREAMNDFAIYLTELTPGDPKSIAIGKVDFDYLLNHNYLLSYDSDSLLKIGEKLLSEVQAEYVKYEKYVEDNHQNGSDSVYIPEVFTKDDILNYYNWETGQIKFFLKANNIISIPENIADVSVVETPYFLQTMISSIAYHPGAPFDTVQHGYFYVRPIPDDLDRRQLEARYRYVHRRGFKGSVIHEAFPGHHLQMQIAGLNKDPVRKWHMDNMMIEGWALYSEEMMYENGIYGQEDPARWLSVLGGVRFRAARIVADVKLHTGQFSAEECVEWMANELNITTESGKEFLNKEVYRYTITPTYQMAYLMGKVEIMKLREAMQKRDGANFNLMNFHDALLAEGSIPPVLMWDVLGL